MAFLKADPPYLASGNGVDPKAVIIGVPLDITETFRSGTREAPNRIRKVSDSLETFCFQCDRDLEDIAFADYGDIDLENLPMDQALAKIERP